MQLRHVTVDTVKSDWVRLKDRSLPKINGTGCIFLEEDGKTCSIYQHRPTQCRTFPYWPSLLDNRTNWYNEIVVPDHIPGRQWSFEDGGCEGMSFGPKDYDVISLLKSTLSLDDSRVKPLEAYRNYALESLYRRSFPSGKNIQQTSFNLCESFLYQMLWILTSAQ